MKEISRCKNDVVFTGSWVARINGKLRRQPKDIDIAVTSLDGLETFGDIICGESNSLFSRDTKSRCKIDLDDTMIDIWVKDELPEYEIIKGMKFQTLKSQVEYYKHLMETSDDKFFNTILTKKLGVLV